LIEKSDEAERGQNILDNQCFQAKVEKFFKKDNFLILFLYLPLTLTLSPQAGRGEWRGFSFEKVVA
jgi:hypothetical protein